jgi:hypothetical protein
VKVRIHGIWPLDLLAIPEGILDLVNDPSEPALHFLALQPILPPDEDEVEKQQ